ncbi:hypothetical protein BCV70DRAFT_157460 [Testicularia cyperi]|uniref:Alpha/beta-hydrolase n=1 Tax=Testicularia cyperi TaxID=1882483 RepID=A0A317XWZ7_9BASI|nr:hypothetical protein BCV70DRAFT_157460 [Testicularia cyperi]
MVSHRIQQRDAFSDQDPLNNEGEDHGTAPSTKGASLVSVPVNGVDDVDFAAYWTQSPNNATATHAFIMMHGKLRDGANYWSILNDAVSSAVAAKYPNAASTSIIVAPEFYSTRLNSGQYSDSTLSWADTNVWQAGQSANHPADTNVTSFDALDTLLDEFSDASKYPKMQQITFVGHGGGAQLLSRYAVAGKGLTSPSSIRLRYVVGDPSSNVYFTDDRPLNDTSVASKSTCPLYNTWRYGFNKFNGTTSRPLETPEQYFTTFAKRDIRWVVGYQDTNSDGDDTCMAKLQGGEARRDRNLAWWRYLNTLAGTSEDLTGFPGSLPSMANWKNVTNGTLSHRLTVVYDADHSAAEVYGSSEGRSALFDDTANVLLGWRPKGWRNTTAEIPASTGSASSSKSVSLNSASAALSPGPLPVQIVALFTSLVFLSFATALL